MMLKLEVARLALAEVTILCASEVQLQLRRR